MKLTKEKQVTVLDGLAHGKSKEKIAHSLGVSPRTIERYVDLLKAKYGAVNTIHLIGIAYREKIIK